MKAICVALALSVIYIFISPACLNAGIRIVGNLHSKNRPMLSSIALVTTSFFIPGAILNGQIRGY